MRVFLAVLLAVLLLPVAYPIGYEAWGEGYTFVPPTCDDKGKLTFTKSSPRNLEIIGT
ncbi:MAG: hypothetical protein V1735_07300 [Nanoarchaeota archaeon]